MTAISSAGTRALIFDPFSGISGDMTLGALLDLGLPLEWLQSFVRELRLGPVAVHAERVQRRGIACTQLHLKLPHEHAHRHLADVVRIIDATAAAAEVREQAIQAFTLLADAEAEVHGTTRDRIHFHEVGALDAIVDILGVVAACREMGFERFFTRAVTLGRGWAEMAHGRFPVPPPAVLKLLTGIPVRDPAFEGECTTPTGAALLQALTGGTEPPGRFVPTGNGFGAGSRDPADRPNCLRLIAAEIGGAGEGALLAVQTDVDDLPLEYAPLVLDAALAAGALDCSATPVWMKKGRAGLRFEALVDAGRLDAVTTALFRSSTSIGVRYWEVDRSVLPRREEQVSWRGQTVRVKRSTLPAGGERAKPEFEDVVRAAAALGMAPLDVFRAMLADGVAMDEPAR